jgi:hypothetical protein
MPQLPSRHILTSTPTAFLGTQSTIWGRFQRILTSGHLPRHLWAGM